jgi:hypothetical protein
MMCNEISILYCRIVACNPEYSNDKSFHICHIKIHCSTVFAILIIFSFVACGPKCGRIMPVFTIGYFCITSIKERLLFTLLLTLTFGHELCLFCWSFFWALLCICSDDRICPYSSILVPDYEYPLECVMG